MGTPPTSGLSSGLRAREAPRAQRRPAFAPTLLKGDSEIVDATAVWFEGSQRVGLVADLWVAPGQPLEMKVELVGLGQSVNAELRVVDVQTRPGKRRCVLEATITNMRPDQRVALEAWLPTASQRPLPVSLPSFAEWHGRGVASGRRAG